MSKDNRMSEKTTSQELSIALKEAGAKQESEGKYPVGDGEGFSESISGFNTDELMERLPSRIAYEDTGYYLVLEKIPNGCGSDFFFVSYRSLTGEYLYKEYNYGDTPAEALGKLYLWCLQNGHIK